MCHVISLPRSCLPEYTLCSQRVHLPIITESTALSIIVTLLVVETWKRASMTRALESTLVRVHPNEILLDIEIKSQSKKYL